MCFLYPILSWAQGDESEKIPLSVIDIGQKDYKVGIKISVAGGPSSLVTLDTGRAGLHILASQLGNSDITYTKKHIKSAYSNGLVYEGVIALAPVSFGKISTPPIPILVIQKAYCQQSKPDCGAGQDTNNPPLIMGHFYGELGMGMIPEQHGKDPQKTLFAPFRALPGNYASGFIIENLNLNGHGRLKLGLNTTNTAGFNTVQLKAVGTYPDGISYYNDKSLMVEYSINGFGEALPTVFDTEGGSAITFFTGNEEGYRLNNDFVESEQNFNASLENVFDWQFTTGFEPGVNKLRVATVPPSKDIFVNTGISFFLNYDLSYDFKEGMLGFRPHE